MNRGCSICSFPKASWKQNLDGSVSLVLLKQVRKAVIIPDTWEYRAVTSMRAVNMVLGFSRQVDSRLVA